MIDTGDLERRLADLGDVLAFDEEDVADMSGRVLARVDEPIRIESRRVARLAVAVAAAVVLALAVLVAVPGTRHAIARWFGLTGVDIVVDPNLAPPASAPSIVDLPGPGESRVLVVDDHHVLVSTLAGAIDEILLTKTVGGSDQVREVDVGGHPGVWVAGAPHEVMYRSPTGDVLVERAAANTLLWQDGDALRRVEGFDHLADARAFAMTTLIEQGTGT